MVAFQLEELESNTDGAEEEARKLIETHPRQLKSVTKGQVTARTRILISLAVFRCFYFFYFFYIF